MRDCGRLKCDAGVYVRLRSMQNEEELMSVKASVSRTDHHDRFARGFVDYGHYPSLSAVVQRGFELVRPEAVREEVELRALRTFFEERSGGAFISAEEGRKRNEDMIAVKRCASNEPPIVCAGVCRDLLHYRI